MEIAILLFADFTALDAIGPYEVLSRIPDAQIKFVALHAGRVTTANQMCTLFADFSLHEVMKPDVVIIPGGFGSDKIMHDQTILNWIRKVHETSLWTASVCTGSLILASAGLLKNREATSHWTALDQLSLWGATPIKKRVVKSGKIITSAGVLAGIDMAFELTTCIGTKELAKTIQISMEYDGLNLFHENN